MSRSDLIFLFGEHVPKCLHQIDKQFEDYSTLQYMASGRVGLSLGQRSYEMEGRWFWSAFPGPRVRFGPLDKGRSWPHRYLAFKGPRVTRWVQDGLFPVRPQSAPGDNDYGPRFDTLLALSKQTGHRDWLRAVHELEGILLDLAEAPTLEPPAVPWLDMAVRQVAAWACKSSAARPDYDRLAGRLGISPSTLRRRFAEALGTSPHGYLLQCRIAVARELLGGTDLPVKRIAARLGYRDVFFFSRQFRQVVGVPPAAFRRTRQVRARFDCKPDARPKSLIYLSSGSCL